MVSRETKNPERKKVIAALEKQHRKTKQKLWKDIAERLKKGRRNRDSVNVWKLGMLGKKFGKKFLLVPGKVLGQGEIEESVNVIALEFSETAKKKIGEKGKAIGLLEALEQKIKASDIVIVK